MNSPAGAAPVPVPFPPIPWNRRPDCLYFLRGMCNKGDKCVYRHNENARLGPREPCPAWTANNGFCSDPNCMYLHPKMKEVMGGTGSSHPSTPTTGFVYSSLGFHSGTSSPYSPEKNGVSHAAAYMPPSMYAGSPPLSSLQMRNSVTLSGDRTLSGPRAAGEYPFQQKRVQSFATLPTTNLETFLNEIDQSSPPLSSEYVHHSTPQSAQMLPLTKGTGSPAIAVRKMSFDTDSQPPDLWNQFSRQQLLQGTSSPMHLSAQASPRSMTLPPLINPIQPTDSLQSSEPYTRRKSFGPESLDSSYPWISSYDDPSRKETAIIDPDSLGQSAPALVDESPAAGGSDDEDGQTTFSDAISKNLSFSRLLPASIKDEIQSSERSDDVSVRDDLASVGSGQGFLPTKPLDLSLDSPPLSATQGPAVGGAGSSDKNVVSTVGVGSLGRPGSVLHVKADSSSGSASASSGSNKTDGQSETAKAAKDYRVPVRSIDSGAASDTSSCMSGSGSDFTADYNPTPLSPLLMPPLPSDVKQMNFDEFTVLPGAPSDITSGGLVKTVKASRNTAPAGTPSSPSSAVSLWLLPTNIINPLVSSRSGSSSSVASSSLFMHVYSELARLCDFSVHTTHKGIVPYIGFCSPPRDPFCIVSAYVPPATLYNRVQSLAKEGHTMSFAERIHVCISVANVLKVMHSNGIVHGNLTPLSVHVLPDRTDEHGHSLVQVSGYGILSVLSSYQSSRTSHNSSSSSRSRVSAAESSPQFSALQFMDHKFLCFNAPEVLLPSLASVAAASIETDPDADTEASTAMSVRSLATEKSDIYGFGVLMLFMLLDGVVPFEHQTTEQFIATVENRVKSHSKTVLSLSPTLQCEFGYAKLLDKCLRIDPSKRPSNMDAILSQLSSFV